MTDRISILVVEDEALIRLDIFDQLSEEGFQVFQAANADEAIALLANVNHAPTVAIEAGK